MSITEPWHVHPQALDEADIRATEESGNVYTVARLLDADVAEHIVTLHNDSLKAKI